MQNRAVYEIKIANPKKVQTTSTYKSLPPVIFKIVNNRFVLKDVYERYPISYENDNELSDIDNEPELKMFKKKLWIQEK
ncbi:unnamed protein product [Rhizophagus irregularis]|nr:unnamed protein product [Rhizophagus irregularis]CAB5367539.1 unnamed protein product [Rhizophagus irregularis]